MGLSKNSRYEQNINQILQGPKMRAVWDDEQNLLEVPEG